ncbi:hypothetical protein [Bandra megavirus]|uniref:Uncharacterized protein n=1 Tax=Bandra megavirus TaxID=2071566 RepID=A0A2K9V714_9VIRU|nr:hypothetical protein [Bandra megavirus]
MEIEKNYRINSIINHINFLQMMKQIEIKDLNKIMTKINHVKNKLEMDEYIPDIFKNKIESINRYTKCIDEEKEIYISVMEIKFQSNCSIYAQYRYREYHSDGQLYYEKEYYSDNDSDSDSDNNNDSDSDNDNDNDSDNDSDSDSDSDNNNDSDSDSNNDIKFDPCTNLNEETETRSVIVQMGEKNFNIFFHNKSKSMDKNVLKILNALSIKKNNYNQNMLAVLINNIICEVINYECDHMYIINNDIKKYNNEKHDKKYLKISDKNKIRFIFVSNK